MVDQYDKEDSPKHKPKKFDKEGKKREFKPPKKISEKYLYNSGLAYLQRYPASSMHFKSVMSRKIKKSCRFHEEQDYDQCVALLTPVIAKFLELGLLDDSAYLKGMVISLRRKGLGANNIKMRLQQKGYKGEEVLEALKDYDKEEFDTDQEGDFHAGLIYARKKRLGPYDVLGRKTPEKALAAMARAGYSYGIAKKILELNDDDLEEYL